MKIASAKEIKDELKFKSAEELRALCLHLSRFKKENKELLTYLLFEAHNEEGYVDAVKEFISSEFSEINTKNYYWIRKSVRKILAHTKKFIRYSKKKETQVELLLHFCNSLKDMEPSYKESTRLRSVLTNQVQLIEKTVNSLHPDLQYEYRIEIENLYED